MSPPLRRHQLVGLSAIGWAAVQRQPWDIQAQACIDFWAGKELPLVVTQQRAGLQAGQIALGLPAPLQWHRRRFALDVSADSLQNFAEFPTASEIGALLPPSTQNDWWTLTRQFATAGANVRVFGSYGWQRLTGLNYLRVSSDVDLRLLVPDIAAADQVAAALGTAPFRSPQLDGELMFPNGNAVAWREWQAWRYGRADQVLVKRLHGASLESSQVWMMESSPC